MNTDRVARRHDNYQKIHHVYVASFISLPIIFDRSIVLGVSIALIYRQFYQK